MEPDRGTSPSEVGGLNVQFTVSTSSPGSNMPSSFESWNSLIVADVKRHVADVLGPLQVGAAGRARDRRHRRFPWCCRWVKVNRPGLYGGSVLRNLVDVGGVGETVVLLEFDG